MTDAERKAWRRIQHYKRLMLWNTALTFPTVAGIHTNRLIKRRKARKIFRDIMES